MTSRNLVDNLFRTRRARPLLAHPLFAHSPVASTLIASTPIARTLMAMVFSISLFGCTPERDPEDLLVPQDVGTLVIDGMLIVGEPFPQLILTRTISPKDVFDINSVVVNDANIWILDVEADEVIAYESGTFGRYFPMFEKSGLDIVQPDRRYQLLVQTQRDEELTAETTTPPAFSIPDWVLLNEEGTDVDRTFVPFGGTVPADEVYTENSVTYRTGLLEAQFSRPGVQAFQVGITSLDLDSEFVIDPDFFEEEDFEDLERIGSSPPLLAEDGKIRLPWFAIYFAGRYNIKIFAMDDNWFDLARSLPDFGAGGPGFGGQAGDGFERPIFRVNGGIGLFGSAAVDSIGFFVVPK